jgi:hypothetical protein
MQIGEPKYKTCPHCGKKNEYYPGPYFIHYYGLTEWSDGEIFKEFPSRKESKLQKCSACNQFYWFIQKGGGMSFYDYAEACEHFQKQYSRQNIVNFIFKNRNRRRILYIRLNILRIFNDRIRIHPLSRRVNKEETRTENETNIFKENAKYLLPLLRDIEPHNSLLLSEVYRNLGDFEMARFEINKYRDINVRNLILKQIENKNTSVITIKQP